MYRLKGSLTGLHIHMQCQACWGLTGKSGTGQA